ncbi:MAG: hypothetical protein ACREUE_11415, partial [Panacagrimonas sp.]
MMRLPRTAISLYVALAVHALVLLAMALGPPSQESAGRGQGLSVRSASLSLGERRLVMGPTTEVANVAKAPEPVRATTPPAPVVKSRRLARERPGIEAATVASPTPTHPQWVAAPPPPREDPQAARDVNPVDQMGGGGRDLYFARLRA